MEIIKDIKNENFIDTIEKKKDIIIFLYMEDLDNQKELLNNFKELNNKDYILGAMNARNFDGFNIAANFNQKSTPSIIVFKDDKPILNILGVDSIKKYINILKY